MAVVEITKARIIKAIRTEPTLYPAGWAGFHPDTEQKLYDQGIDHHTYWGKAKVKDTNCSVCAVGAVMRDILSPSQYIQKIEDASLAATGDSSDSFGGEEDTMPAIKARAKKILTGSNGLDPSPMVALSYLFESLASYYMDDNDCYSPLSGRKISSIRRSVVSFVEKNFPDRVQIDIDGAKPAKDVKVIKKLKKVKEI